jgi:hypothetical protein
MHLPPQKFKQLADFENRLGIAHRDLEVECFFDRDHDLDGIQIVVQSQRLQHAGTPLLRAIAYIAARRSSGVGAEQAGGSGS